VRCLPDRIPTTLDVDISALEIGDSVHVGDIAQPEGVEFLVDAERTVCSLMAPTLVVETEEEAAAAAVEGEVAEPEVIARGKEDDGDDK
jgi:large subunit ribosomal protein L25